ncbi:glycosyltransferase family 2 protein [Vibrio splendidus]|uniref:glycosyltransferase family 2 protein n=1 Tax=Vibrio splendidus TaxID=29497 RepID=UPI0022369D28|nr:glycosyltransferase family A protein [Vibrio splendidus]MCW4442361.1 glycosyltransferase family 2 protein [Vibrio splendidus]
MKELISVVIPAKDRVEQLRRTLLSVLNQQYNNIEILVVENNSSFPEKIDSMVKTLSGERIDVHHLSQCANANVARNYGAKIAQGDYIAFLDSDDEWLEGHLEQSLTFLQNREVDFVYGGAEINTGKKVLLRKGYDLNGIQPIDYLVGLDRGYAQTSSFLITKSASNIIKWDESMKRCQDLDYFVRVANGLKIACMPKITTKINWIVNEKRDTDLTSMMNFLAKYRSDMKASSYFRYVIICLTNIKSVDDFFSFIRRVLK